ncbi:MAG TPA: hypothetical protein VGB46_02625 [Flavisolibacter sp.]|jgi:hypothetical protein
MTDERNPHSGGLDHSGRKPKDVQNVEQGLDSCRDPLEQQLEKSQHMNLDSENQTLDALKQRREQTDRDAGGQP